MIPDLYKDIKIQLYERATSPLLGSFVISWCLWNYKLLMVVFSSSNSIVKFSLIKTTLYPGMWDVVSFGIFFPLITTLVFIFIYPIPALYIYEHTRKQQVKLKKVRQKIEDETPLTQKEAREIRSKLRSLTQQHDDELNKKDKVISDRDATIIELNASLDVITEQKEQTEEAFQHSKKEILELKSQHEDNNKKELSTNKTTSNKFNDNEQWKTTLGNLTNAKGEKKQYFISIMAGILHKLNKQKFFIEDIMDLYSINLEEALYIMDLLRKSGFVGKRRDGRYHISSNGRNFAIEYLPENILITPKPAAPAPQQRR